MHSRAFSMNWQLYSTFLLVVLSGLIFGEEQDLYMLEDSYGKHVVIFTDSKILYMGFASKINDLDSFVLSGNQTDKASVSIDSIDGVLTFRLKRTVFGSSLAVFSNGKPASPGKISYVLAVNSRSPGVFFLKTRIKDVNDLPSDVEGLKKFDLQVIQKISLLDLIDIRKDHAHAKDGDAP